MRGPKAGWRQEVRGTTIRIGHFNEWGSEKLDPHTNRPRKLTSRERTLCTELAAAVCLEMLRQEGHPVPEEWVQAVEQAKEIEHQPGYTYPEKPPVNIPAQKAEARTTTVALAPTAKLEHALNGLIETRGLHPNWWRAFYDLLSLQDSWRQFPEPIQPSHELRNAIRGMEAEDIAGNDYFGNHARKDERDERAPFDASIVHGFFLRVAEGYRQIGNLWQGYISDADAAIERLEPLEQYWASVCEATKPSHQVQPVQTPSERPLGRPDISFAIRDLVELEYIRGTVGNLATNDESHSIATLERAGQIRQTSYSINAHLEFLRERLWEPMRRENYSAIARICSRAAGDLSALNEILADKDNTELKIKVPEFLAQISQLSDYWQSVAENLKK